MQLIYSELDKRDKSGLKINSAGDILISIILSFSFVASVSSLLGLRWSIKSAGKGNLTGELKIIWNTLAEKLGSSRFILIERLQTQGGNTGLTLFLCIIFFSIIAFLIIKSRQKKLLTLYVIPMVILDVLLDEHQEPVLLLVFVFFLALAYVSMESGGKSKFFIPGELIGAMLLATAIILSIANTVGLEPPSDLVRAGEKVGIVVNNVRYGQNDLKNGALNSLQGRKKSKETALEIICKNPEEGYLRGFIGEEYRRDHWCNLRNENYYAFSDLQYWLHKGNFSALNQICKVGEITGRKADKKKVELRVIKGDRRNLYLPYELKFFNMEGSKNLGDAFLRPKEFMGKSSYSYFTGRNTVSRWTDEAGRLFSAENSRKIQEFFNLESHYNVFVYDHYTGLSDETKQIFASDFGKGKRGRKHRDYKESIERIKKYLNKNFIYTETFEALEENKDFMADFIKMRRGCDVHFATAGALLFRYCGIPARYVEGFIVTAGDIEKSKGFASKKTVSVPMSNNHAWIEIYIDGYGWVPVEVTPEYKGIIKEADFSKGLESAKKYEKKSKRQMSISVEKHAEKERGILKGNVAIIPVVISLILILIMCFLRFISAYGKKALTELKFRCAMRSRDDRTALCAAFDYMNYKRLPMGEASLKICNRAAFSNLSINREDRKRVFEEIRRGKH